MVAIKHSFPKNADGSVDLYAWLRYIQTQRPLEQTDLIEKSITLTEQACLGLTTFYGQPIIEQSLEMAEIILDLNLDQEAVAATIAMNILQYTNLTLDSLREKLGDPVADLVKGVKQINTIYSLPTKNRSHLQIDRLRKAFLAMVSDIRAVLIKLAERTTMMRGIKNINQLERKRLAQETLDIYAPLANRLGIGQLKWELEDIAFHYIDPDTYKTIAAYLSERRIDREKRIQETLERLKQCFAHSPIHATISGRAKHIYSIYLKMQRKDFDYKNIYDYSAVRIMVPTEHDCYSALSIVHGEWEAIPEEFDDYIANPKPNGYRSIHTAVVGPGGKPVEIQIRSDSMHQEAELGVAAHWLYKEKKAHAAGYEAKITFLRQLLAWRDEVTTQPEQSLNDTIYVFTPAGDIIDLSVGATPLDFAYHIHSEVGHRCKGAKVNNHIVPLTYTLQMGDRIEVLTHPQGTPSRDWLNKDAGYLKTARAMAKASQWFRQQEIPPTKPVVSTAHQAEPVTRSIPSLPTPPQSAHQSGFHIAGIGNLLTRVAKCCKPIPGDAIMGYISIGRGVSIHRHDCNNIKHLASDHTRIIQASWDSKHPSAYYVDLHILAQAREEVLKEITTAVANADIRLISLNSSFGNKTNRMLINITIQINSLEQLKQLMNQITLLPSVLMVKRMGA